MKAQVGDTVRITKVLQYTEKSKRTTIWEGVATRIGSMYLYVDGVAVSIDVEHVVIEVVKRPFPVQGWWLVKTPSGGDRVLWSDGTRWHYLQAGGVSMIDFTPISRMVEVADNGELPG